MLKYLYLLWAGLLCTLPLSSSASQTIEVLPDSQIVLGDKLQYLVDAEDNLTIIDILNSEDKDWHNNPSQTPNFGYTDNSYWFRFTLNLDGLIPSDKILAIDYPLLDHIELYHYEKNQLIQHVTTGDTYPFKQRPISHRNFLFPITLYHDEPAQFYIKLKTQGSTQLPIALYDFQSYALIDQDEQVIKAIYYGMMFVMGLYNLFLFFSIRERPYFYYVAFIFSMVTLMAGAHGFLFQYIFPDSPDIHKLSILVCVPGAMLFACLFASQFLRLQLISPNLNAILNLFSALFLLSAFGAFFLPYDISTRVSVFMAMPACIVIIIAGPYAWLKRQTSARFFTIAWLFLLTGMVLGALSKFGFIPRNLLTEYAVNFGSAIEALLLSFALADRLNRERNARFKAQKERLIESVQRKKAEEKLYYQATHQAVDGLPNMVLLQQVLHKLIHSEEGRVSQFTLVFIHLEHIHEINKTLGHANADLILSLFSERLNGLPIDHDASVLIEESEKGSFHFCHIEGVVFAHILKTGNSKQAELTVKGMRKTLAEPIEYNGMRLDLGLTIGIASYPIHGADIATLIRHTRVAIDAADNSNRHIGIYSSDINPYSARRLALIGELKKAMNENTLELYFQPIVDSKSDKVVSAEALLRWNHPKLGFIPPCEFITLAEKTGIMRPLTQWVLQNALIAYSNWKNVDDNILISLNISAINLQEKDFAKQLLLSLDQHHISTSSIILEVTETSVMENPDDAIEMLNALADNGIKIAIDDFGTGHSSLSYIQKLPVYEVKIDRSFISNMDQTQDDALITRTALNLSHGLGYKVVAEGVENHSVLNTLQGMGCDYVQGYHIARPMPAEEFRKWLKTHRDNIRYPDDSNSHQTN